MIELGSPVVLVGMCGLITVGWWSLGASPAKIKEQGTVEPTPAPAPAPDTSTRKGGSFNSNRKPPDKDEKPKAEVPKEWKNNIIVMEGLSPEAREQYLKVLQRMQKPK